MIGIGIGVKQQKVGGYGLAKPVATAATGVGQTSFTANWNAYTGAVVYLLDVSTSPTFDTFIYENQEVNAPSTSYVVIGLEPNTTYYYRVRASTEALTDPDAQAFFDRVTTAGGSLSATEQTAINTLVLQMKTDGIWSKMKAIYPMVGASAAACAQNLKSSSFTGTFTSGWTFASTGVKGNGTSAYMDTGLNARSELTFSNTHISAYSRTNSQINANAIGVSQGAGTFLPIYSLALRITGDTVQYDAYDYNTHRLTPNNTSSLGFYIGNVASSTSQKIFKNSSVLGTITAAQTETQLPNYNFWIATRNDANTGAAFDSREYAFFSIGDGLTDTEVSNFYTAVQAFQTTLARQV